MAKRATAQREEAKAKVHQIGFSGDDGALVAALVDGHPGAPAALFDRYGSHVERVLASVIGIDPELPDLLHEVFARALAKVGTIEDPERLKAWITRIAVYTARGCIRRRKRGRWLRFWEPEMLKDLPDGPSPLEAREALAAIYDLLERLSTRDQLVFSLRFIGGLELTEVAVACGVSLATIKRHLAKAEGRFLELARHDPVLAERLEESPRWRQR
jgi:RNA polymerase sigma-70 factor (ECF subfamily)